MKLKKPVKGQLKNAIIISSAAAIISGCFPAIMIPRTLEEQKIAQQSLENEGYTRKYNTTAHECLDAQKFVGTKTIDYKVLDDLIDAVKNRVIIRENYTKYEAIEALTNIRDVLNEAGFSYKETEFFNEGLKIRDDGKRYLDCDTYSSFYLGAAEEINLPLLAVSTPGHMFVRCHYDENNYFNWETTSGGEKSDESYIDDLEEKGDNAESMKELTKNEFLARTYINVSRDLGANFDTNFSLAPVYKRITELQPENDMYWVFRGTEYDSANADSAIYCYNRALAIREWGYAYRCLGGAWLKKGDFKKSIDSYRRAIQLEPEDGFYYFDLGEAFSKKGDLDSAINYYTKAIQLRPDFTSCYERRGEAWKRKGDSSKWWEDMERMWDATKRTLQ